MSSDLSFLKASRWKLRTNLVDISLLFHSKHRCVFIAKIHPAHFLINGKLSKRTKYNIFIISPYLIKYWKTEVVSVYQSYEKKIPYNRKNILIFHEKYRVSSEIELCYWSRRDKKLFIAETLSRSVIIKTLVLRNSTLPAKGKITMDAFENSNLYFNRHNFIIYQIMGLSISQLMKKTTTTK